MPTERKSFDDSAQVVGQVLFAFAQNLNVQEMMPTLQKYALVDLREDQWYSVKTVVDFFNEISAGSNAMFNLVSIGVKISTYCIVPPEMDTMSFADFLEIIDRIYHMQHRGDVGQLIPRKVGEKHYTVTSDTPYPDDFWYGIYFGWGKRLLPKGTALTVMYDETEPRQDRGGGHTVTHIKWG